MTAASACSPFRLVAADYQPLEWTLKRLGDLTERVSMGNVQPLPLTCFCFETAEIIRAFNELRRGDHIGRYVASIAAKSALEAMQPADCHPVARIPQLSSSSLEVCVLSMGASDQRHSRSGQDTHVQLRVDASTAILQLNDPEHFNTFSTGLGKDMHCALQHVRVQPSVGCVVLQGAGAHFSAGGNPWHQQRSAHQLLATQHSRRTLTL